MTDLKSTGDEPMNDITASVNELLAETSAAAGEAADVRTFRGRSLEELIPRIREALGSDAVVLRSSEGFSGGIAGFFQRRHVEVEARAPLPHERHGGELSRNDRATTEGMASAGVRSLIDGAQPFAAELAFVESHARDVAGDAPATVRASAFEADFVPSSPGLYGPQPNLDAMRSATSAVLPAAFFTPSEAIHAEVPAKPSPAAVEAPADFHAVPAATAVASLPAQPRARTGTAGAPGKAGSVLCDRLVAAGLSADLAADLVGEAVDHHVPFANGRPLEHHVRVALARRIPVLADLGPGARTLAFVGAGGSGKTSAAANLAVAYAAAGRQVAVVALGDADSGRDLALRLEPLGIFVHVAGTGQQARDLIDRLQPMLAIVDACESADPAETEAVLSDLRAIGADEIHLALPATLSAAAAAEAHARHRTLGVTHICLTHADATAYPGAPVGLSVDRDLPVSYCCTRATIAPAAADELTARLLP